MRSTKIFVVLLNWNGKKDTIECLSSLAKVQFKSFQPLVVDNGSTDGSVVAIREAFPNVPILENHANLGFAGGNNPGIEWALSKRAEWILLLNNDTIVAPDFLNAFMEAANCQAKAKILGAKIYRFTDQTTIDHLGGFWNEKIAEFESPAQGSIDDGISFEKMEKVDYVCGAALLMHRSVPETIGLLEPRFFFFGKKLTFVREREEKDLRFGRHRKRKSGTKSLPHLLEENPTCTIFGGEVDSSGSKGTAPSMREKKSILK